MRNKQEIAISAAVNFTRLDERSKDFILGYLVGREYGPSQTYLDEKAEGRTQEQAG